MAMEKHFVITDTHSRFITAIGFHPIRREIVVGFEDGVMKWWEQDTGKLMLTSSEHTGFITDFQYWSDQKLLLSAGNDGAIMAWGSGGNCMDKIRVGHPVYTMCLSLRKKQIICGVNGGLQLYLLDPKRESGHVIDARKPFPVRHHYDIVPCVIVHESRVFSAGYDGRFCIYDSTLYPGKMGLDLTHVNSKAHDAGITCMVLVRDNENNTWLITGGFDRSVKIWSQDGQLRSRLETIFIHAITSLCYIPRAKVVWIASASHSAIQFDPKAGENVTEFLPTFQSDNDEEVAHKLLKLRYNPESAQIVGSTNRRQLIVWKYNSQGCVTALRCDQPIESIAYTRKVPMLLFSGGSGGEVYKWERLQSSYFMYSMETLTNKECADRLEAIRKERGLKLKESTSSTESFVRKPRSKKSLVRDVASHYADYNKALVIPSLLYKQTNAAIFRCSYVEHLDFLLLASEDGYIYVWGFDMAAVDALTQLTPEKSDTEVDMKFSILLDPLRCNTSGYVAGNDVESATSDRMNNLRTPVDDARSAMSGSPVNGEYFGDPKDSVTNRVAGFICRDVLIGHSSSITAMVVVRKESLYKSTYLLSSGWDRKILIWCLETGKLMDRFRSTASRNPMEEYVTEEDEEPDVKEEFPCDGYIIDMEYCEKRNEFAYASSDGMVYIRAFSTRGCEMVLRNTLHGEDWEMTVVRWNDVYGKWITAAEDGSIHVWSADGMSCERTLSTDGPVHTICIDKVNGSVVAAVEKILKVYDLDTCNLVQTHIGHTENIRCILHFVERSQYITGSWDQTVRVWNAYKRLARRRRRPTNEKKQNQIAV